MDVGGAQNSSAPISATASGAAYAYTDTRFDQHQPFTFADGDIYPTLLELTTPSYNNDWVCAAAPTESSLALAPGVTGAALLPKSPDTGDVGSFGPTPLPIPFALQHTPSALHEIPAAQLWGAGYAETANGAAVFGGTPPDLAAVFAEALPQAAGYDVAGAQVGLDEFINAL